MMEPARTPLTIATTDLCAITQGPVRRGRQAEESRSARRGWVPPNASLTPFDIIDLVMTDIVELDGAPWECCPRSTLKQAPLVDFEGETGLTIVSAFEQEF